MSTDVRHPIQPATAALLVLAPLLMLVGRLLAVPFNDQDWEGVLTEAAAHQGRSDAGWLLAVAASGLLGACALTLAQLLRTAGRSTAAAVATVTTALGWAAAAGISTAGLIFSVLGQAPDRGVQVQVLRDLNAGSTQYVFLMCVIAAVGHVVLAVALTRAGVVGKGAATALGLGAVGTLLCVPGPVPALAVFFALVLLAGHVLVLRSTRIARSATSAPEWERVEA